MISVVLGIGSNCGDRRESVEKAVKWLETVLMQTKVSEIYETPCANQGKRPYMNAVMSGYFSGDAFRLDDLLKEHERAMGRNAECREKGDVPVDIDIVICDGTIFKEWDYRQKFFRIGYDQIS